MRELQSDVLDAYGALSVQRDAQPSVIDEAYWLLLSMARERLAPGVAALRIEQLNAAYDVLSDPGRRKAYDDQMEARSRSDAEAQRDDPPGNVVDFPARVAKRPYPHHPLPIAPASTGELIDLATELLVRESRQRDNGDAPDREGETLVPMHRLGLANATDIPPLPPHPGAEAPREVDGLVPMHRLGLGTATPMPPAPAPPPADEPAARPERALLPPLFMPPVAERLINAERAGPVVLDDALSARRVITSQQKVVGISLFAVAALSLILWPLPSMIALVGITALLYTATIGYKGYLAALAITERSETPIAPEEVAALSDDMLPIYTVLLPLYRETSVLRGLVRSIEALEYPPEKLDVKLLLEEDDIEMQRAVAALNLPPHFERLIVPDIGPKGKPRACNYGLSYARGKYLALYDAEDRPEPDQLKKALIAFGAGGKRIACVQAKLNFYNPDQNLLTKWFTIEYSTWFDLYLPALNRLAAPIPLGGTSNHFRVAQLRQIGAWDEYNVTEDADLGLRLARCHLRTSVIDSVTYEEANSHLGNWIRQRSRWVKGYIQTWLVHMRHPVALFRDLGAAGFFAFQVMVFGTFFTYFINPVFWVLVVAWYATHAAGIESLYPAPVLYLSALAFFAGNFVFIFTAVAGSLQRGFYHGVKYALVNHLYWALMSVASWKALVQLIRKPHYWEKTQHGLDSVAARGTGTAH